MVPTALLQNWVPVIGDRHGIQHVNEVAEKFMGFSLALDETTDIKDTAQLSIFIRGVDKQNVTEEFLDLISLKDTTSENDIQDAVIKCVQMFRDGMV